MNILTDFPNKQDVLRYTLIATAPETKDNDFTWKDFQARNNNELVAILGNFINRTMVLTANYFDGKVPTASAYTPADETLISFLTSSKQQIGESIEKFRFREALSLMMDVARAGNKYLADNEPWKLIKTDAERTATVLQVSLEVSAYLAIVMEPFLPHTADKLRNMLNIERAVWNTHFAGKLLKPGHTLNATTLLFDKIEDEAIVKQVEKLAATKLAQASAIASTKAH